MKSRLFPLMLSLAIVFGISGPGCFTLPGTDKKKNNNATDTTNTAISNSMITLPRSLSTQPTGGKRFSARTGGGGGMDGIYYGVTQYIGMADMVKDMVKELLLHIVNDSVLKSDLNKIISIPVNPLDPGAPKYFKVEKPVGEAYEWKISLYFTSQTAPEMIIRFTIVGNTAKGRVIWSISEADEDLAAAGITLNKTISIDVTFDATTSNKTMEIRFVQDLETAYAAYLNLTAWNTLTAAQKEAFDLGQPGKVFVNVAHENGVYTIYGTSYHPLWAKDAELRVQDMMWDSADRNIYMFKAKAIESDGGAKLYLALPLSTTSIVTDSTWIDNSVGNIFTNMMVKQLNDMIAPLAGGTAAEKQQAFNIINWILGSNLYSAYGLTSYSSFSGAFIEAQRAAAASFWAGTGWVATLADLTTMQNYYNTLTTTTNPTKETFYKITMAQAIIDEFTAIYNIDPMSSITKTQLEAFVNNPNIDSSASDFQTMYKSIKSIINPAFFNDASGFLGTLDETNNIFYQYINGTLTESSDMSSISGLKDNALLDLSGITMYVPTTVVSATIVVQ